MYVFETRKATGKKEEKTLVVKEKYLDIFPNIFFKKF